jgi:hypothetical protein
VSHWARTATELAANTNTSAGNIARDTTRMMARTRAYVKKGG